MEEKEPGRHQATCLLAQLAAGSCRTSTGRCRPRAPRRARSWRWAAMPRRLCPGCQRASVARASPLRQTTWSEQKGDNSHPPARTRTLQLQRLGGVYHDSVLAVYHCVPATSASPQWRREVMMSAPARRLRRGCQVRDAAGVQPHRPGCVSAAMPRLWATEASSRAQPSPPSKPMGAHTRTAEAEAAWSPDSTTGATSAI